MERRHPSPGRADRPCAGGQRLGRDRSRLLACAEAANPTLILERGEPVDRPPVLVVHGTADANVPHQPIVDRFLAAYRARGGQADLVLFPGAPHRFARQGGPDAERRSRTSSPVS
ncbi:MAG TPA: prolyl oligopeptidase family serine peptidase [Solirubrobacteraceae bacterium]